MCLGGAHVSVRKKGPAGLKYFNAWLTDVTEVCVLGWHQHSHASAQQKSSPESSLHAQRVPTAAAKVCLYAATQAQQCLPPPQTSPCRVQSAGIVKHTTYHTAAGVSRIEPCLLTQHLCNSRHDLLQGPCCAQLAGTPNTPHKSRMKQGKTPHTRTHRNTTHTQPCVTNFERPFTNRQKTDPLRACPKNSQQQQQHACH